VCGTAQAARRAPQSVRYRSPPPGHVSLMDPASTAEGDTIMYAVKSGEILAPERSGTGLLLAG